MNQTVSSTKTINISLPQQLLGEIDKAAKHEHATRSGFIRDSILHRLNAREQWEIITDLTTVQKGGVDINDLLKHL